MTAIAVPTSDDDVKTVPIDAQKLQDQRNDFVAQKAIESIDQAVLAEWMDEAKKAFPDPQDMPTVTLSSGMQLRRNGEVIESLPKDASEWMPLRWIAVEDLKTVQALLP